MAMPMYGESIRKDRNLEQNEIFSFVASLKACAQKKDILKGNTLHIEIMKRGMLEKIPHMASALINMYGKCGMIADAQQLHDKLRVQSIASWNALLAGYAQQERGFEALACSERMQSEGFSPNAVSFVCTLNACGSIGALNKGQEIHNAVVCNGLLHDNNIIGNALVDVYCKCGMLVEARAVHDELSVRNVISWSSLIAGYAQHDQGHEALDCFMQMQKEGLSPNAITLTCILKACSSIKAVDKGKQIHDEIVRKGLLTKDMILGTALVDMYVKFSMFATAQQVLDEFPVRDVISWNVLVGGYTDQDKSDEALNCFECMQIEGLSPNVKTYVCILKACSSSMSIEMGAKIHDLIATRGLLDKSDVLCTAVVDMYVKFDMLGKAKELHDNLPSRSAISWNTLITGYVEQGRACEALNCLEQMQTEGISPDAVTFVCILKVCGDIGAVGEGARIHNDIVNRGMLKKDVMLGTSLVAMYAKCGFLVKAAQEHNDLPFQNAVSWNALIAGYVQQGQANEPHEFFARMQIEGFCPNEITFACILKASGSTGAIDKGKRIHCMLFGGDMLKKSVMLGNALVDMYVKCHTLDEATQVFKQLPIRDVISWSSMIAGYVQQGQAHEALNCFELMQGEGVSPNAVTFVCTLNACGSLGAMEMGKQIHDNILNWGLQEEDIAVGNALVHMYAKCSAFESAVQVLLELGVLQNVASWNALITGYAQQGKSNEALGCFKAMEEENLCPNEVTFLCVLNACCHAGLLHEAQAQFGNMTQKYGLRPGMGHYTCMVVIYGHAGLFEKAASVIRTSSCAQNPSIWLALLGACKKWGNVKLGRLAFDQVVVLEERCAAAFSLMAAVYAMAGMQVDATKVQAMMRDAAAAGNAQRSQFGGSAGPEPLQRPALWRSNRPSKAVNLTSEPAVCLKGA